MLSIQTKLILPIFFILISSTIVTGQETTTIENLDIGVVVGDRFEFKINNFEEHEYFVEDFVFPVNFEELINVSFISEDILNINITRIQTESSENICWSSGNGCIYYTPEIYVDLNFGSSSISGIINLSPIPFGALITTTDWALVEKNTLETPEETDDFIEDYIIDNSFNKEGNQVTIGLDINVTIKQNEETPFPFKSIIMRSTSVYNTKTGVLQTHYAERQFIDVNGTQNTRIQDISNTNPNVELDKTLSIPILTFNQTIFFLITLNLIYYRKQK